MRMLRRKIVPQLFMKACRLRLGGGICVELSEGPLSRHLQSMAYEIISSKHRTKRIIFLANICAF